MREIERVEELGHTTSVVALCVDEVSGDESNITLSNVNNEITDDRELIEIATGLFDLQTLWVFAYRKIVDTTISTDL